jgi:hypothetical protein
MGQYVYEWVDDPRGREAIFKTDFTRMRYGIPFRDTPFRRRGATGVTVAPPRRGALASSLEAFLDVPGARSVRIRYSLPHHHKALYIDMVVDKERVTDPESIYMVFPFALTNPTFHLDLNGVALEPEVEQLPGSCRDWYGVQRWAEVSDSDTSVVLVPVDAPLVQVGGITTGRWAKRLQPDAATLVSWPVQNHWTTNFKASQSGELLFRYRLTSMPVYDPAAASRFAAEQLTPPIIVRAPGASTHVTGQFLTVEPEGVADVQIKRAANGEGLIVRAFNFTPQPQDLTIRSPLAGLKTAWLCSPIEEDGEELGVASDSIVISAPPRALVCARMIFEEEDGR